ncbi:hypothetical protein N0V83_003282 [Neocucurbitaria cava]|uniref:BTB domain-containing protein n=1 Tax=Neocucurbitaria cava TaxID=798079 RepID=A0A9W9CP54_9PLEO|nr:hypothetical protein N0V83_003282 [Neocucurbitaria cava]
MWLPPKKTPKKMSKKIKITPNSDCEITVSSPKDTNGQRTTWIFIIEKDVLVAQSKYFKASFRFNEEHGPHAIHLEGDGLAAIQTWLYILHGSKLALDVRADVLAKFQARDIWDIIVAADKYQFKISLMNSFFEKWYKVHVKAKLACSDQNDKDVWDLARIVVLPCALFDYAEGFAEVTKWLAYNSRGHIAEKRPEGFKWEHIHLAPPDFVGPMNSARGRLKTVLHTNLWTRVGRLFQEGKRSSTCTHAPESAGTFLSALVDLHAYPLELVWPKNSVTEVLSLLSNFRDLRTGRCSVCTVWNWKELVEHAVVVTEHYFDGLCLDCMNRSRLPRGKDPDTEYWNANGSDGVGRWDSKCRITHGQPTWYHSFLGRHEDRQFFLKDGRDDDSD